MLGYLRDKVEKKSHERDITSAKALGKHFSGTVIADWVPQFIADYKTGRRATISATGRRISDATIGKELMLVSAAIKHANLEWGWDLPNILKGRIPLGKVQKIRWLRWEESDAMLEKARLNYRAEHLADYIELGMATGMRPSEILFGEWDRVDFSQRLIYLNPDDQKGGFPGAVPLNETALRVLRSRLKFRLKHCPRSRWIFATKDGERIGSVKHSFASAASDAGVNDVSPHTLRHTFAARLVQSGVPLRTVCELCRHKDIRTTMRYAHLAPENAREAIKVLDRVSGFGQGDALSDSEKSA